MKSNSGVPGGSLMSKPTWSNTSGVPPRRFFLFSVLRNGGNHRAWTLAHLKKEETL